VRDARHRGGELVELGLRVVGELVAGVGRADGLADGPEAGDRLVDRGRVADDDRDVRAAELLDGGTLGQAGTTDSLKDYQCAGEKQGAPYWFDQNATTWSGNVLLLSKGQIDAYKQQHPGQSFRVVVIEDDDTACQIKMDADRFKTLINTIDTYYQRLTGGRDTTTGLSRYWNRASAFQKILQSVWSFITTQDEFVGNAVQDAVATEFKPGYNWIVKGENNITNGALKLEMR